MSEKIEILNKITVYGTTMAVNFFIIKIIVFLIVCLESICIGTKDYWDYKYQEVAVFDFYK